jgi:hypothetical protein
VNVFEDIHPFATIAASICTCAVNTRREVYKTFGACLRRALSHLHLDALAISYCSVRLDKLRLAWYHHT